MLVFIEIISLLNFRMSSVNRESVREETQRLKTEFERLSQSKKMDVEIRVLIQGLLTLINLLFCIFMEKTTQKNSKNSSKPSSQTDKDDSSLSHTGSKGKGKLESGQAASNTRTIETVTLIPVDQCAVCGKDLRDVPCNHIERRTEVDIVFEKVVTHTDVEVKDCPVCEAVTQAPFPEHLQGPLQYGAGLKAYVINLIICQMVSLKRAQSLLFALINEKLSEATFLKFILRLYERLETWENAAIDKILLLPSLHVDETSLRVDKKRQWIHVYASGDITLKFLHPGRGLEAMEAIHIIPRYSGTIIHDCLASYLSYHDCDHGLCGSHLVRELTAIIEANGYVWAMNLKKLLLETCKRVSKRKKKRLSNNEYALLQKRYRNIITRGEKELPSIPAKPNGKRGKMAKSDAHNLWERFKEYETAVLLFAKKSEVAFTNNRAERDLRMAKVKQKVSGCFRSEIYAKAYCRISSYLQTMASKGYNPLVAIEMALANKILA